MQELICPSCKIAISVQAIEHVNRNSAFVISHALCNQCSHAYMVLRGTQDSQSSIMLSTELSHQELSAALNHRSLTSDDVLALHSLLSETNSTRYLSHH